MNLSFTSKFLANVKFLNEKRTRDMQNYLNELDSPDTVPLTPCKGVYGHLATNDIKINRLCTHLGLLSIFYFFAKLIRVDGGELTSQWRLC